MKKEQTFEDYLGEQHAEQFIGTKDVMIDDFSDWLQDLPVDDLINFADKYHIQEKKKWREGLNEEEIKKLLWKSVPDVHEEVDGYELRADNGDYMPKENERMLIEDFTHGFLEELIDKMSTAFSKRLGELEE